MGDVKRYRAWTVTDKDGNAALLDGRFIVLADDYDDLLSLHQVSEAGWKRIEEADDKLKAVCDALRTRLAEAEKAMKAVNTMCLTTCNGEPGEVHYAACLLALSEAVRILNTALGRQPLVLTSPTQEPTE